MGRMLIYLVMGMSVLLGIAQLNMNHSNARLFNTTYEKYEKTQARYLAASGIKLAVSKLTQDTTYQGVNNLQSVGGTITIGIQSTNSQYPGGPDMGYTSAKLITSTGTVNNQTIVIRSVLQLASTPSVPPFMEYAIASGGNLHLQGSVSVVDDGNTDWNANIHTNADLETQGNAYRVEGFGTYAGNLSSNKNRFFPNQNPDGAPVRSRVDPIELPNFNPSDYLAKATNITNGNLNINGSTILGTKQNPVVWYVNGNLSFHGTTTGYGVFIVTGNITFNGNVSVNSVDPTGSNLGFYAGGNIQAHGNITLAGQMYAVGDIQANGNFTLSGSMTAKHEVQLAGNPTIRYRPANPVLTTPFWDSATNSKPLIVSYYE